MALGVIGLVLSHSMGWIFQPLPAVNKVQVPFELAPSISHYFDQGGLLHLLPGLEQVKVHIPLIGRSSDYHYESIRDAFKPLIAARQRMGRPIMLSWV
jgi:hypothetical protein